MCPDGTYVAGSTCHMTPNGGYVGGKPAMAPNGNHVAGSDKSTTCPDGPYVSGSCHMTPNGRYVGD